MMKRGAGQAQRLRGAVATGRSAPKAALGATQQRWKSAVPEQQPAPELSAFPEAKLPFGLRSQLFGNLADLDYSKDVGMQMIAKRAEWYKEVGGDTVTIRAFLNKMTLTRDMNVIREVLGPKSGSFTNGNSFRKVFGVLFPTSVIVLEGAPWKRVRTVIQRAVNRMDQSGLPAATTDTCRQSIADWDRSLEPREVALVPHFARISFDAFHKTAYGIDFGMVRGENSELLEACVTVSDRLADRLALPMPILWKFPTASNRSMDSSLAYLKKTVREFIRIEQKRVNAEIKEGSLMEAKSLSLLDAMIKASLEDSKMSLSVDELADNIATLKFGAFDTTSATVSILFDMLARNPEAQQKLYESIKDIDLDTVALEDLMANEYLVATLNELNRMSGIASLVPRDAKEDVVLQGNILVKKDTAFLLDTASLGLMPDVWEGATDLHVFRPDRWLGDFKPPHGAFMPFGFGGRQCPGKAIAMNNMATVTAFFVQRFELKPGPKPVRKRMRIGFTLHDDDTITFVPRANAPR